MPKKLGMNKHQKAAHRPGEEKVSRAEIGALLELSCSSDVDERLTAARYLCPCHIQTRRADVAAAIFRMMEDDDPRVRFAAWHTWEDGGLPNEAEALSRMEQIYQRERDAKVRRFAATILKPALEATRARERTLLHLAARPLADQIGKCDFCGAQDTPVTRDLATSIPTATLPRPAWTCAACANPV